MSDETARDFRAMWTRRRCGQQRRSGASAVEFALIAPIFMLLVFGMIEYGRMMMVQQVITNASREGARRAVLTGATNVDVVNTVVTHCTQAAVTINGSDVTVTPIDPADAGFGEPVEVAVTVSFDQVSWLPAPMYLGGRDLVASTVMRRESDH